MPAIRSQISSSSSTMRISDAISDPFLLIFISLHVGGLVAPFAGLLAEGEGERHLGPLAVLGIGKDDVPAMVFHDLAHDGEPKPRALGAGGDIGLGQAMAMLGRQAYAVVADANAEAGVQRLDPDGD